MGRLADYFDILSTGFTTGREVAIQKYAEKFKNKEVENALYNQLPDGAGKKSEIDEALVAKTSPTIWAYDIFCIEWDRRSLMRNIETMLKSDTRIKRANHVFAATAVRRGITVTVTSKISQKAADKAQEIVDQVIRDCQINSKLMSWARILLKEGDLFLNPVIDIKERKIKNIKRLPGISMQRNDDITGNFPDLDKAFRQIDPISLISLLDFPLWSVNHIRWDHEEGDRYGNSQYLACLGYWKKLNMTEEDLVVRRRTRAPQRRLHQIGDKERPSDWKEVEKYKDQNKLNSKTAHITTDYFMNGIGDIKNLDGDEHLDQIKDVEYLQEIYMIGTGVPLHLIGFGQAVTREGPVQVQMQQFKEDVQELRDLLEYGDSSPYSGLRFILDFALALGGIDPALVDVSFRWFDNDNETANDRIERVVALRNKQKLERPFISLKTGLTYISKDFGLDTEEAIEAEMKALDEETLMTAESQEPPDDEPDDLDEGGKNTMTDATTDGKVVDFFHYTGEGRRSMKEN